MSLERLIQFSYSLFAFFCGGSLRAWISSGMCALKPVTHEQVFFDKFWLGKFYLLVCKEEFVNFFLDKCTCSKASMIAFEQVQLARKKLSHCRICSSVRVDKKTCQRKYGNWGRTAVLLLWFLEYRLVVNGKSFENFAHLLLIVLAKDTAITKGKTPVPVCSPKLSPVGRGWYLDGWPSR